MRFFLSDSFSIYILYILVLVLSGLNQCITMERIEKNFFEWLWTVAPHAVLDNIFVMRNCSAKYPEIAVRIDQ